MVTDRAKYTKSRSQEKLELPKGFKSGVTRVRSTPASPCKEGALSRGCSLFLGVTVGTVLFKHSLVSHSVQIAHLDGHRSFDTVGSDCQLCVMYAVGTAAEVDVTCIMIEF